MTWRGIGHFMVLTALVSSSGMMKLGRQSPPRVSSTPTPHEAVSMCVIFFKTWRHGVPPSPNPASDGCMALTLVVLVAIQKDSSEGGGITWVLNGPMDEVWGAVQSICQLTWYGWELTLLSQGRPQPRQIPISLAMKGGMGPQNLLGGRDV